MPARSVTAYAAPLLLAGAVASTAFPTFSGRLSGVSAMSASSAWAVGYTYPIGSGVKTLIEQWNGTSWK
jgi:hypothetical protein